MRSMRKGGQVQVGFWNDGRKRLDTVHDNERTSLTFRNGNNNK